MVVNIIENDETYKAIASFKSLAKIASARGDWFLWDVQDWSGLFEALQSSATPSLNKDQYFGLSIWDSARILSFNLSNPSSALRKALIKVEAVIEIGAGVGVASFELARRYPWEIVVSDYDVSTGYLFEMNRKYLNQKNELAAPRNMQFRCLDWNHEVPRDCRRRFDLVVATDVLYQVCSLDAFLTYCDALLTVAGRVILADPKRFESIPLLEELDQTKRWNVIDLPVTAPEGLEADISLKVITRN